MIEIVSERKNWSAIDLDSVILCHGLLCDVGYTLILQSKPNRYYDGSEIIKLDNLFKSVSTDLRGKVYSMSTNIQVHIFGTAHQSLNGCNHGESFKEAQARKHNCYGPSALVISENQIVYVMSYYQLSTLTLDK